MTTEELRAIFVQKFAASYRAERGRISAAAAYQSMNTAQRSRVDVALEQNNLRKAGAILQHARTEIARQQATDRLDAIFADDSISVPDELNELINSGETP